MPARNVDTRVYEGESRKGKRHGHGKEYYFDGIKDAS